jgi:hypothetical protein
MAYSAMSEEEPRVRVRSREDEELTCSRKAASRAGTLSGWIDNTTDDGSFPTDLTAADLRVILGLCEDDDSSALASHSLEELVAVMTGANYLDAPVAFSAAARQFHIRFLAGKSVEELRTNLGAENDMSDADQAAALAEPAFTPPPSQEQAEGPPRVQRGVSLLAVKEVLEVALQEADAAALCRLKAVSVAWCARARRELCNRLCCREGQPEPTGVASITDLDVEVLNRAGRPWEVVVAGRQLPQLARLHGFGFLVDVQEARQADWDPYDEGGPPHELLLAAVACAASGTVWGVPVQRLREDDAIDVLDLEESGLGVISAELLSLMLPAATSVRSLRCVPQTRPSRHQPAFPRCTVAPTFLSAPIDMPTLSPSPPHPSLAQSR